MTLDRETVDRHLRGFDMLVKTTFAMVEVRYHYEQLKRFKAPEDMQDWLQIQGLLSACVIAYGRIFGGQSGSHQLTDKVFTAELKPIHNRLLKIRDARFAHNLDHQTVKTWVELVPEAEGYVVRPAMGMSLPYGPQPDFEAVFAHLDAYLHDEIKRRAAKMSERLGVPVRFADGPAPEWISDPVGEDDSADASP